MIEVNWIVPSFMLVFASLFPGLTDAFLARHLSPDATLAEEPASRDAAFLGLFRLYALGVENPVVLSVKRIDAPLSGYLLDAYGSLEIQGRTYYLFRLGIRDQGEAPELAWSEFVFLAGGRDCDGNPIIFPPQQEDGGFVPEHEYLGELDEFLGIRGPGGAGTNPER